MGRSRPRRALGVLVGLALLAACTGDDGGEVERSQDASTTSDAASDSTTADPQPSDSGAGEVELVRLALPGVDSLDPVAASPAAVAELVLADLLYDTLTIVDDLGRVEPGLATFAANADRTVWRFTLVDQPTFADGSPITPDDVVYSLRRVIDQGERSIASLRIETIEEIRVAGADSIDIVLAAPSAVLPEVLSSPMYAITDADTMRGYLEGGDQTPNASGDYLATIDRARRLVLDRRRGVGPQQLVLVLLEQEDDALDAFLAGEVDWSVVPPDRLGEALEVAGGGGLQPFQAMLLLGLDVTVPPVDRIELRRAVALAIDRQALADAVFGQTAAPLFGLVPSGVPGQASACLDPCGADLEAASAAAAAAFPDGQDREVRLLVDDSTAQRAVAGVLEEQIGAAGVDVEVDSLDADTYEALIASGQQQLFIFGWVGVSRTPASYVGPLFSSSSPDNVTEFADDAVDLQIAAALSEPIATERGRRWAKVEAEILQHVPVVPLVQFRVVAASRPGVTGIQVRVDGTLDLSAVRVADTPG